ncbi:MAG: chromate resistance protein [Burkholderiaceae bacterium]|nr:chromate resistance protein [Burkholderiaceae bacterium]
MWSLLLLTLPTQPNAVRVRVWRALKSLGCAALRDGAYLLPATHEKSFEPIAADVRENDGSAMVFALASRDAAQSDELVAMFDRGESYAQWHETAAGLRSALATITETEARRRLRAVAEALQVLGRIDYFPGTARQQAQSELDALRQSLETHFASGEPRSRAEHGIARLKPARFQRRRWATRARPWVDRLACAWLIRRFIDPHASFVWLADPARAPRGVLGFDYDGARFTHVGARVSFEVLIASFSLEDDARLQRIAKAVRYLDAGGIPAPEAAGIEAVLGGLRMIHADDDQLAAAAATMFDALYAAQGETV